MVRNNINGAVTVYILLKTRFDNVGDALINRELIELLSRTNDVIIDTSYSPPNFTANLKLETRPKVLPVRDGLWRFTWRMWQEKRAGGRPIFLLMPGGNKGEKSWPMFVGNMVYNYFLRALRFLGIEYALIGVSYENLGPKYLYLIKHRMRYVKSLFVRDKLSYNLLRDNEINCQGIVPDLAFNIPFDIDRLRLLRNFETDKCPIAFSFRTGTGHASLEEVKSFIGATVAKFPGHPLKFVSQVKTDSDLMLQLADEYRTSHDNGVTFDDISERLDEYKVVYRDCGVMFSNRLHALLLSMSAGTVPIAILKHGRDVKIRGVFDEIGLQDHVMDVTNDRDLAISNLPHVLPESSIAMIDEKKKELSDRIGDILLGFRQ